MDETRNFDFEKMFHGLRLARSNVDHTVALLTMKLEGPRPVWKPDDLDKRHESSVS